MNDNFKDGDKVAIDFYSYGEPLCTAFGVVDCGGEYISVVDGMIPTDPSKIYTTRITPCPELPIKPELKWTPIEEGASELGEDVWIQVANGDKSVCLAAHLVYDNAPDGGFGYETDDGRYYSLAEVEAWMPLPERYKKPELPFDDQEIDDQSL